MLQPILLFILGLVLLIISSNPFAACMTLTVRKGIKSGEDDRKEDEPTGGVFTPPLAPNLAKLTVRAAMLDTGYMTGRQFGR